MKGKTSDLRIYLNYYPQALEKVAAALAVENELSIEKLVELNDAELMAIIAGVEFKDVLKRRKPKPSAARSA